MSSIYVNSLIYNDQVSKYSPDQVTAKVAAFMASARAPLFLRALWKKHKNEDADARTLNESDQKVVNDLRLDRNSLQRELKNLTEDPRRGLLRNLDELVADLERRIALTEEEMRETADRIVDRKDRRAFALKQFEKFVAVFDYPTATWTFAPFPLSTTPKSKSEVDAAKAVVLKPRAELRKQRADVQRRPPAREEAEEKIRQHWEARADYVTPRVGRGGVVKPALAPTSDIDMSHPNSFLLIPGNLEAAIAETVKLLDQYDYSDAMPAEEKLAAVALINSKIEACDRELAALNRIGAIEFGMVDELPADINPLAACECQIVYGPAIVQPRTGSKMMRLTPEQVRDGVIDIYEGADDQYRNAHDLSIQPGVKGVSSLSDPKSGYVPPENNGRK